MTARALPLAVNFRSTLKRMMVKKYTSSTALEDGGFVITWTSAKQDGSGEGIYAQRYDSAGGAVGEEFQVNSFTRDWQIFSSVAGLNDGGFVITWSSRYQDGSGYGIYAQNVMTVQGRQQVVSFWSIASQAWINFIQILQR